MDWYSSSADNVWFYLIAFVALAIVPVMVIWWVVAQLENSRRRKAGIPTGGSRWHFLRYGPHCTAHFSGGLPVRLTSFCFSPRGGRAEPDRRGLLGVHDSPRTNRLHGEYGSLVLLKCPSTIKIRLRALTTDMNTISGVGHLR
jgi:hypothetical protein